MFLAHIPAGRGGQGVGGLRKGVYKPASISPKPLDQAWHTQVPAVAQVGDDSAEPQGPSAELMATTEQQGPSIATCERPEIQFPNVQATAKPSAGYTWSLDYIP